MERDDHSSPILSEHELQELLGDDGEDASDGLSPRVLVVLRRGEEGDFLKGQLRRMGYAVTLVHNPFSALDHLRWQRQQLIVSELDLWADNGALLFGRIAGSGDRVPVIFVGERDRDAEAAALGAGAAGFLTRPLRVEEVEATVRMALAEPPAGTAPPPSRGKDEKAAMPRAESGPATGLRGGEEDKLHRATPGHSDTPGGGAPVELQWLRFFFEVARSLRESTDREGRLAGILGGLRRHLQVRTVVVVERSAEGWRVLMQGDGDGELEGDSAKRILSLFQQALSRGDADSGFSPTTLTLDVSGQGGRDLRCLLDLGGAPPAEHRVFLEELRRLLTQLGDNDPQPS